ncbi:MAG: DUF2807 domain-containing protein [Bacteroidales bacterium]|nr:DUF2807 domain-containing protein [Bacteroidales bacterium]
MKKLLFTALALLIMGVAMAQKDQIRTNKEVNTLIVNSSGDISLRQDVTNEYNRIYESNKDCLIEDSVLVVNGSDDYYVIMAGLEHLIVNSSGDVITSGPLHGKDLDVVFNSSGDTKLDLNYDNVNAYMNGSGDLVLRGKCYNLYVENNGSGDVNTKRLEVPHVRLGGKRAVPNLAGLSDLLAELGVNLERLADSVDWDSFASDMERWGEGMEEWGRHMEEWGEQVERQMEGRAPRDRHDGPAPEKKPGDHFPGQKPAEKPQQRSLLFDPHWGGIDMGLNMLLGNELAKADFNYLELRPLRSWVFNFNIADVGIAFNRNHDAGLYTGIGLGWNNYSFDNPVWLYKGDEHLEYELIDESVEGKLKKSKLGMLYIQAPLMIEVRPTRGFFIAAGVTGGIKVDTWMKIKFMDKYKEKSHGDYYSNLLKLDATLRAGGSDMGFFASYNLLPLFVEGKGPSTHTFNVGFTLLF